MRGAYNPSITPVPMTPERWRQVEEIFHAAQSRGVSEREAFLLQTCAGDEALRRDVAGSSRKPGIRAQGFGIRDQGCEGECRLCSRSIWW
jgi:hypothetical protein